MVMDIQKVFVYGAGGHGKVVGDILLARKDLRFAGFIDDRHDLPGTTVLGFPICGDSQWLQNESSKTRVAVALGIGDNSARQRVAQACLSWGAELVTLVHPSASVSDSAQLGLGTVVMAQAAINPDAKIGSGAIVNTSASIDHDVQIGDFAHVAPKAAMGGVSRLGTLSLLGIGAVIIHCGAVGARSVVGAGAVVVGKIPDAVIAFGVPARIHRRI
jgi:sugar O-acyltransferase (sialic acid O-acetyltransferase NeuD family)